MKDYILAFDLGTTGNKAVLVDGETGAIAGSSLTAYPTRYTPDGGAEQSPADWWDAAIRACRELAQRCPSEMEQVAAIGCTGMMNGVVLVDKDGAAVRDSVIHADIRALPQTRALEARIGREAWFAATANRLDCHWTLPKLCRLREYEPEVCARSAFAVQAKDYLVGKLTGVAGITDPSDASLTGGFDVARRVWAKSLWREAGLGADLLPTVVPSTEVVGKVTPEAARLTGLKAGIPVVMGGGDGPCATAGSGAGPDEAYNYLGGTSWIGLNAAAPLYDLRLSNYCGLDGRVVVFGAVQAAGTSLEWLASILGSSEEGAHRQRDLAAASVPPGARNLFFLPYLQGERAPLWDSDARGVFFGLATHHGPAEIYRAVIEGATFALNSILEVFQENGHTLPVLRLLGGGAKSALWRQIMGGIYGRRLQTVADVSSATSLGAAMAAGVGVGLFRDWNAALALVHVAQEDAPDQALVAAYAPRIRFFESLYPALCERFAALAQLPD